MLAAARPEEHPGHFWYISSKLPGLVIPGEQRGIETWPLRSADLRLNPSSIISQLRDWGSDFF